MFLIVTEMLTPLRFSPPVLTVVRVWLHVFSFFLYTPLVDQGHRQHFLAILFVLRNEEAALLHPFRAPKIPPFASSKYTFVKKRVSSSSEGVINPKPSEEPSHGRCAVQHQSLSSSR